MEDKKLFEILKTADADFLENLAYAVSEGIFDADQTEDLLEMAGDYPEMWLPEDDRPCYGEEITDACRIAGVPGDISFLGTPFFAELIPDFGWPGYSGVFALFKEGEDLTDFAEWLSGAEFDDGEYVFRDFPALYSAWCLNGGELPERLISDPGLYPCAEEAVRLEQNGGDLAEIENAGCDFSHYERLTEDDVRLLADFSDLHDIGELTKRLENTGFAPARILAEVFPVLARRGFSEDEMWAWADENRVFSVSLKTGGERRSTGWLRTIALEPEKAERIPEGLPPALGGALARLLEAGRDDLAQRILEADPLPVWGAIVISELAAGGAPDRVIESAIRDFGLLGTANDLLLRNIGGKLARIILAEGEDAPGSPVWEALESGIIMEYFPHGRKVILDVLEEFTLSFLPHFSGNGVMFLAGKTGKGYPRIDAAPLLEAVDPDCLDELWNEALEK